MAQRSETDVLNGATLTRRKRRVLRPSLFENSIQIAAGENLTDGVARQPLNLNQLRAMASSRAMRSPVSGWVLNNPARLPPDSGFIIIIWQVSGCASAAAIGMPLA